MPAPPPDREARIRAVVALLAAKPLSLRTISFEFRASRLSVQRVIGLPLFERAAGGRAVRFHLSEAGRRYAEQLR